MIKEQFNWRAHLKVHPAAELFPLLSEAELYSRLPQNLQML